MRKPTRKKERPLLQRTMTGFLGVCALGIGVTLAIAVAEGQINPVKSGIFPISERSEKESAKEVETSLIVPVTLETSVEKTSVKESSDEDYAPFASKEEKQLFDDLVNVYVYAFPLVLTDQMEREMTRSLFFAPVNKMAYLTSFPSPGLKVSECPNVDSLLSTAWLDLSKGPQTIVFPENPRHDYILELLDAWTNVIGNVSGRNAADYPVRHVGDRNVRALVLVGPNDKTVIPDGMKVVNSPTDRVWLINRVLLGAIGNNATYGLPSVCRTLYEFEILPLDLFMKESNDAPSKEESGKETTLLPAPIRPQKESALADASFVTASMAKPIHDLFPLELEDETGNLSKALALSEKNPSLISMETPVTEKKWVSPPTSAEKTPKQTSRVAVYEYQRLPGRVQPVLVKRIVCRQEDGEKTEAKKEVKKTDVSPQSTSPQVEKNKGDKLEKDLKKEDQSVRKDFEEGRRDIDQEGEEFEDSMERVGRDVSEMFNRGYKRGKMIADEMVDSGRDAFDYFDKRAKRDLHRAARDIAPYLGGEEWKLHPIHRVAGMRGDEFFSRFAELLKKNPPTDADPKMVEAMARLGIVPGKSFEWSQLPPQTRHLIRFAVPFAQLKIGEAALVGKGDRYVENHWIIPEKIGVYGTDYLRRAAVAEKFIGANVPNEILYPFTSRDGEGNPLNGVNRYLLHFEKDQTPPTDLLWSVTLYDDQFRLVPNRLKRYALRSNDPLVYNEDGSLDLLISAQKPSEKIANWLPAPKGEFMLMMRIYAPKETAIKGEWKIPSVNRIAASASEQESEKEEDKQAE